MTASSMAAPQGFVNLDKPAGITSRRADQGVARCFGRPRTGHAGTLDPAASGVLPVAVGGATRLAALLSGSEKEYRARLRLGLATDTDDAAGRPLAGEKPVGSTREEVERALEGFRGEIMQRPPAYSALKRGGRAAHRLARAGRPVELVPRRAAYRGIEVLSYEPPELELLARVAAGTYLRALARDLGERLGCGGHLAALRRTRVGALRLEDSVSLERLRELAAEGRAAEALLPVSRALPEVPALTASGPGLRRRVAGGQPVELEELAGPAGELRAGAQCLILEPGGRALALAEVVAAGGGGLAAQPRRRIR